MKILVTGAKGFVGRNLCENLKAIRDGKIRTHPALQIEDVFEYDLDTPPAELDHFCADADFVFNLAGVNRPQNNDEFMQGNFGFASTLLDTLKLHSNTCPVMLSSSIQATLIGRYAGSEYGKSKLAGEEQFFAYGQETGAPVYVYRFPNLFGTWCRPNYTSAVATFCNTMANDWPITVNDPSVTLRLVYIDDVVEEFLRAMEGQPHREGEWCTVQPVHEVNLGHMAELIQSFPALRDSLTAPDQSDPLVKKLYATYLSFLPPEDFSRPTVTHADQRGSFTELLHMGSRGQVSLNVSKPHITKGDHWHQTKHEKFIVLQGEGVIRFRKVGDSTVIAYKVSGENLTVVDIPTGYTHSIENTGDTDMLTLMWANELFDPNHPDTFFQEV